MKVLASLWHLLWDFKSILSRENLTCRSAYLGGWGQWNVHSYTLYLCLSPEKFSWFHTHWYSIDNYVDDKSEVSQKPDQNLNESNLHIKNTNWFFLSMVYSWYMSENLVFGCYETVLAYEWCVKVVKWQKMWILAYKLLVKKSGTQLVYDQKTPSKVVYQLFFCEGKSRPLHQCDTIW